MEDLNDEEYDLAWTALQGAVWISVKNDYYTQSYEYYIKDATRLHAEVSEKIIFGLYEITDLGTYMENLR